MQCDDVFVNSNTAFPDADDAFNVKSTILPNMLIKLQADNRIMASKVGVFVYYAAVPSNAIKCVLVLFTYNRLDTGIRSPI